MHRENSTASLLTSATKRPKTKKRITFTKFFTKLLTRKRNQDQETKVKQSTTTISVDKLPDLNVQFPEQPLTEEQQQQEDDKLPEPIPPVIPAHIRAQSFPVKKITENKWEV